MSWYQKGSDVVEQQVKQNEEARKNRPPRRIWLPPNNEVHLVYLDDAGFSFYEHAVDVPNKKFPETYTCLMHDCPLCASGSKRYLITLYSVIDLTIWRDAQGVEHKNEKKVHALKAEAAYALQRKKERWNGLTGYQVIVSRKSNKDFSSGGDFELALMNGQPRRYNLDLNNDNYKPFDYERLYQPKSKQELVSMLQLLGKNVAAAQGVQVAPPSFANPPPVASSRSYGVPSLDGMAVAPASASVSAAPSIGSSSTNLNDDSDVPF